MNGPEKFLVELSRESIDDIHLQNISLPSGRFRVEYSGFCIFAQYD